jgi:hypothetical protein
MLVRVPFRAAAATRLSCQGQGIARRFGWFRALARLSLVTAAASMLSGCLVDDPPPYVPPAKTPPRLDYSRAEPGLDQLLILNSGDLVTFKMPVTSEDAGDPLYATVLLDYVADSAMFGPTVSSPMPASTLEDKKRVFSLPLSIWNKIEAGCHRFTLRVTHQSNLVLDKPGFQVIDKADLAEAFWFANINVAAEDAGKLVDCPSGGSK